MSTTVLTLAGTGTTGIATNAVAAIDIPQDGVLVGCDMEIHSNSDYTPVTVTHELIQAQLNFISTAQFLVNDGRGALCTIAASAIFLTTGTIALFANKYTVFGDGIPVAGGERIFVHTFATTGPVPVFEFNVMYAPRSRLLGALRRSFCRPRPQAVKGGAKTMRRQGRRR